METEKQIYNVNCKCIYCFVLFTNDKELTWEQYKNTSSFHEPCGFCTYHPEILLPENSSMLARRMINHIGRTEIRDFSKIIKFILSQVKLQGEH